MENPESRQIATDDPNAFLRQFPGKTFEEQIFHGFLPRIFYQQQRHRTAYGNYYQTYVERDVRQLIQLKDVGLFEKFMKLLAGRVNHLEFSVISE